MYLFLVGLFLILANLAVADDKVYETEDVVVTATRIPTSFADINRDITIITSEDIEKMPVQSFPDLLAYIGGVDLKTRGAQGVQADMSIRGSSFEQTLLLIDGVKVNDSQTGHHNFNIPLDLHDIDRIEVLKGGGSSHYGPGALGGVVNIITKSNAEKGLRLGISGGDFEYADLSAVMSYPIGNSGNTLSISRKRSGGYTEATDFETTKFRYAHKYNAYPYETSFSVGYVDKEFGANRFYSDNFPNEWERVKTTLINAGLTRAIGESKIAFKTNWRRHEDDFILDNDNPDWYRNKHTTDTYGTELQAQFKSSLGITAIGGEIANEEIASASLGNHARMRGGVFLEHQITISDKLTTQVDGFIYKHENYDWDIYPSLNIGYKITPQSKVYGSISKSYRVPTFTDLYYVSPANVGNPDLVPEESFSYELGYNFSLEYLSGGITGFRREGDNLIDWVRIHPDSAWQVMNVAEVKTTGLEISLRLHPDILLADIPVHTVNISYTVLDSDREFGGLESKYGLDLLEHQLLVTVDHALPFKLNQVWKFRYEATCDNSRRLVTDTRIVRRFDRVDYYLELTNIFDYNYHDIGFIPMPGRQVIAGVSYKVF